MVETRERVKISGDEARRDGSHCGRCPTIEGRSNSGLPGTRSMESLSIVVAMLQCLEADTAVGAFQLQCMPRNSELLVLARLTGEIPLELPSSSFKQGHVFATSWASF